MKKDRFFYVKYAIFARFFATLNFRTHAGGQPGADSQKNFFALNAQENVRKSHGISRSSGFWF